MANAAAQKDAEEIPLIEEHIETGLDALLESYRADYIPGGEKKDELKKQFVLMGSQPLPEFDHTYAKAYKARDLNNPDHDVYALVLNNDAPFRQLAVDDLSGVNQEYMVSLYDAGTVPCSHLGESRQVFFLERPQGTRLSELMKTQPRMHEHRLIDHVMQPVAKALMALREHKTSHGNICPSNFFIGDTPKLGECYSTPCGALTPHYYEPPERMAADPLGRGDANEKSDIYALGILAFELVYGLDKIKALPRQEYLRRSVELGVYNLITGNRDLSDNLQDFLRGVLTDDPSERWGLDEVNQWLAGKRFNMIAPSAPKEASRAMVFAGQQYLSRRLLATDFHISWREAVKDVRSLRLDRWCETSLHKPDMGEAVERALRIAGEASNERQVWDMMTRIISVLDPSGPMRCMSVAVRPDGIGPAMAQALHTNDQSALNQLLNMIDTDVSAFWSELDDFNKKSPEQAQVLWRLGRVRPFLKNVAFGFGVERLLYDLNPSLACQSDLLRQFHVTTAAEALQTLDALSRKLAPDTSFADRHLAAFMASRMDLGKEMRLRELNSLPALATNPELVVLRILARAQQKEKIPLVGLTTWAAMRVEKMLDEIHNRVSRKQLKLRLKKIAASGSLNDLMNMIVNRDMAMMDHNGFAYAIALHQLNHSKIERFRNPRLIDYYAKDLGGKMASNISYAILAVTGYITLSSVMGY